MKDGVIIMNKVYEFLKECNTFYIATCEGDQPRVRPFGALNIFENKLYIETAKAKNVSKQMQINPKIEICACSGSKWVRVEAKAIRDDRFEAKKSMIDNNPPLKALYSPEDDNTEVLYLDGALATFYSFGGEPEVIEF